MYRHFVVWIATFSLLAVAFNSAAPTPIMATEPAPSQADYVLNSEGDEWTKVEPGQVKAITPVPTAFHVGNGEESQPTLSPPVLESPESRIGIALDRARNAGPTAVLAFVASQENPHLSLLEEAVRESENLLRGSAPMAPAPDAVNNASVNSGPCAYTSIQLAVNAAANGNTVRVASGSYTETVDIGGGKVITIEGGYDSTCTTLTGAPTTINGNAAGSVVDVSTGSVAALRNLILTGGSSFGAGLDVLGSSTVTLFNTDIFSNTGSSGGGIYVGSGSVVTFSNDSDIYGNTASANGGGAIVYGRISGFDSSSDIYQNSALDGGGIAVPGGVVQLNNSDVVANTATNNGGGFSVTSGGIITLTQSVFVGETTPCCQSATTGGGIYANAGHVYITDSASSVMNNTATNGGGLYLVNGSRLVTTGGRIGHDLLSQGGNDAVLGAGLYAMTSTVDFSGSIINNIASNSGGGIYATSSTINLTNATVGGTSANQHNQIGASGLNGAGMYLINNTQAMLNNTVVVSNTLSNLATGYGGGIYVRAGSVLTATNSRIEQHFLPSTFDGRGAGLYLYDASVTLNNTGVLSNTASDFGGGARLFGASTLNVLNGSSFVNNRALSGEGGAIAATNTPVISATNAIFQSNSASTHGGAIYLDAGTLSFDGHWDLRSNSASGSGGAVAVSGTGNVDFLASAGPGPSNLSANHADGDGGALYVTNADAVQLHAVSGLSLTLTSNSAGGNGGAVSANGGALLDVYGDVQATLNSATGNGGAFYLANGSRTWLDDYFDVVPKFLVNTAANGGAIYAFGSPRVECDGAVFGTSDDGNKATTGSGGAIYLSGSALLADNCTFRNNEAQAGNGGAIAAYTSTLSVDTDFTTPLGAPSANRDRLQSIGPLATGCNPLLAQCSSLSGNSAISSTLTNGFGGAIYVNASTLSLANTFLHRNSAVRGGAVYQEGTGAISVISNTLVYSNTSLQPYGAGIRNASGAFTITNGTVANNTGGAGYSVGAGHQSYVYNTIIWGNSAGSFTALTAATCNIDQAGVAGPVTNPQFFSPGSGENYRLLLTSPAIDTCDSGLARDILNVARPTGSRYDMGAYETTGSRVFIPVVLKQFSGW